MDDNMGENGLTCWETGLLWFLSETASDLERQIMSSAHPCRRAAAQVEPSLGRNETGEESGQTAVFLVFAMFLARCAEQYDDEPFWGRFISRTLTPEQPLLNHLLGACQETLRTDQLEGQLFDNLARRLGDSRICDPRQEDNEARYRRCFELAHTFEILFGNWHDRLRHQRGVFFTPQPIAAYIIDQVTRILQTDFECQVGTPSPHSQRLQIVDPACGSGVFLLQVLEQCRQANNVSTAPHDVNTEETANLIGIDVMPGCCAAARLLIECYSSGTRDHYSPNVVVQCANSLTDESLAKSIFAESLPVIVGNPPYANFGCLNRGRWIDRLLQDYKRDLNEKKTNLTDDFIKFIRWGQFWIDQAGRGVLAMITSNTYLSGLTHRRMRSTLMASFDRIDILNLHGDRRRRDRTGRATRDDNVFNIQQGVAISLFSKFGQTVSDPHKTRIHYASLRGSRESKLDSLGQAESRQIIASPPNFFFTNSQLPIRANDYHAWPRLNEIFNRHISGVQTKRDSLFVASSANELKQKVQRFLERANRNEFSEDIPQWLRKKATGIEYSADHLCNYMVAPWDVRWLYYDPRLLGRARQSLLGDFESTNLALVFMRQTTNPGMYDNFMATNVRVSDRVFFSALGAPFVAPLLVGRTPNQSVNLSPAFIKQMETQLGASFRFPATANNGKSFSPYEVFHWLFASVHRTDYRQEFDALLRIDFPRIPWPTDWSQFQNLVECGCALTKTFLDVIDDRTNSASQNNILEHLRTGTPFRSFRWRPPNRVIVNSESDSFFKIANVAWEFRIGGYQVLHRWLKQRSDHMLSDKELTEFCRLVDAVRDALRTIEQIDQIH